MKEQGIKISCCILEQYSSPSPNRKIFKIFLQNIAPPQFGRSFRSGDLQYHVLEIALGT